MTLTEYVHKRLEEVREFEEYWRLQHEAAPIAFPKELCSEEDWHEQELVWLQSDRDSQGEDIEDELILLNT